MGSAPQRSKGVRVGCDIGGTFTDIVLAMPDGRLFVNKTSTTPEDLGKAIVNGLRALIDQAGIAPGDIAEIVHGTTTASNTILQKVGANTGVLTTEGFRDVLEMGRESRYDVDDLFLQPAPLIVPRSLRLGVGGRLLADGSERTPLDEEGVARSVRTLVEEHRIEALAIALFHAYRNPAHERRARQIVHLSLIHI